ncbi:hypothetical protein LMH87_009453 [Akanthomyces muscarius]|uniref:Protein ZIP4 homolog n=1 Tax=Akanthomyces muscarius TaxID=2231603 RepID=A0A9W8ULW9_AKAMU|nr:hypothetical protein LMH87_009453 [Akanthomyces muscarius]KAJ4152935.1 hypothetical protein LMH87_009453 [Akanthomyces muscarius]
MNVISSAKETLSPAAVGAKATAPLLHFAIELESSTATSKPIDPSNLEHYTLRANDPSKFPVGALDQDTAHQLESVGRRLWNTFLRKQNCTVETHSQSSQHQFYLRARLFGYLLLGIGLLGRPDANADQSAPYLTRLGLALSKVCINQSDLESARIALQKVTEYLPSSLCETAPGNGDGPASSHADYASYYVLRIALSWKDDRLDLAEHMYSKATQHTPYIDTGTRTTLVHVLMHIGNSFSFKSNLAAAVPWFRRAAADSSVTLQERSTMTWFDVSQG